MRPVIWFVYTTKKIPLLTFYGIGIGNTINTCPYLNFSDLWESFHLILFEELPRCGFYRTRTYDFYFVRVALWTCWVKNPLFGLGLPPFDHQKHWPIVHLIKLFANVLSYFITPPTLKGNLTIYLLSCKIDFFLWQSSFIAGPTGLEPVTYWLTVNCTNLLCYGPKFAEGGGLEPNQSVFTNISFQDWPTTNYRILPNLPLFLTKCFISACP